MQFTFRAYRIENSNTMTTGSTRFRTGEIVKESIHDILSIIETDMRVVKVNLQKQYPNSDIRATYRNFDMQSYCVGDLVLTCRSQNPIKIISVVYTIIHVF